MSANLLVHRTAPALATAFERQAADRPDCIAIVEDSREFSYAALNSAANRLALEFTARVTTDEGVVGLLLPRGVEMIVGMLAARKAGLAYLPLDPEDPPARNEALLRDAGVSFVAAAHGAGNSLAGRFDDVLVIGPTLVDDQTNDPGNPARCQRPSDLAYIMFTSGSTGRPKGVEIEQRSIWNLVVHADYVRLGPESVVLHHSPVSFDASTFEVWGPLLHGARCVIVPERRPTIANLERAIQSHGVTTAFMTTLLFNAIIDECPQALRGIDELLVGGQAMSAEHARRAQRALPSMRLKNIYGPTECTTFAACHEVPRPLSETASQVPIGRPIAGTIAMVINDRGQEAAVGEAGELWLAGAGVARGYRGQPELTEERFVQLPSAGRDRAFRTGDRALRDRDGNLTFLGRFDDQVKLRGFRIEPGEVAATLLRHPAVAEATVVQRESPSGAACLVAYLAPRCGQVVSTDELRKICVQFLPRYMRPAAFVIVEKWPQNAHGKLDRSALPAPDWPCEANDADQWSASPRARQFAEIWSNLLGVAVGVDDDVFVRGADSLTAMRFAARVESRLGQRVSLETLLACATARQFAAASDDVANLPALRPATRSREDAESQRPEMTPGQASLWFLSQLAPQSPAYNVPVAFRIHGPLDVEAVRQSIVTLVERHQALRTTFAAVDGVVRQRVAKTAEFDFCVRSVASEGASEGASADRELAELLVDHARQPFDLGAGPLLRAIVVRAGDESWALQFCTHHIVTDGWSVGVFLREFAHCYNTITRGVSPQTDPLPMFPGDDLACQSIAARDLEYWRDQLVDAPQSLDLPRDRQRCERPTGRGDVVRFRLAPGVSQRVTQLARAEQATEFMVLLSAYAALLHRYSGQDEMIVGAVSAGRGRAELDDQLGYFATTLPLRIAIREGASFRQTLRSVRQTSIDALEHASAPFPSIVEAVGPDRAPGECPFLHAVFVVQSAPRDPFELSGVAATALDVHNGAAKFDLTLSMTAADDGWIGELEYACDLFDRETAEALCDAMARVVEAAVAAPDVDVSAIPVVANAEQQRIEQWSRARASYRVDQPLHGLFERRAALAPDNVAAEFAGAAWTYAELNRRAEQFASALRGQGVGPGDIAALCAPRSLDLLAALLGVLKTGAAYLPIEPTAPPDRIRQLIADAHAACVIVERPDFAEQLNAGVASVDIAAVNQLPTERAEDDAGGRRERTSPATPPNALAYVIYTSGSTGRPKGVEVTHENVVRLYLAAAEQFDFNERDVWTCFHSIAFDFSVWEIWGAWLTGAKVVLVSAEAARSPADFLNIVRQTRATVVSQTPTAFRYFIEADQASELRLDDLRYVVFGGEILRPPAVRPWTAKYGLDRPQLVNMYGITETTVHVTHHRLVAADLDGGAASPIGVPLADLSAYVLDERRQLVPIGAAGELYVGGAGVARGYRNQPELTAERFLIMDVAATGRVYRTGDRVRWTRQGRLEFLGRVDRQLKLRGHRIEPGEIETQIESLLGSGQACVDLIGDVDGDPLLAAWIATGRSTREGIDATSVRSALLARLPDYMVPGRIVIVENLPLTHNGKIDRRELARLASAATPVQSTPRTHCQRMLVRIWRDLLDLEDVGIAEDFFAVGGHSLLAVRLVAQIERETGRRMPLSTLFHARTIEAQAAWLEQAVAPSSAADDSENLVEIRPGRDRPPLYFMHDIHGELMYCRDLVDRLPDDQPVLGFQAATDDNAEVDLRHLAAKYVDLIQQRQPDGPYHIAGWSFGGMLAYAVACELERRGAPVGVVGIIDTSACWYEPLSLRGALMSAPRFFGNVLPWLSTLASDWDARRAARRFRRKVRTGWKRAATLLAERGTVSLAPDFEDMFDDDQTSAGQTGLARSHFRAFIDYRPSELSAGVVVVLRASTRPLFYSLAADLGWKKWVRGTLVVHDVPGAHGSILAPPTSQVIADRLAGAVGDFGVK